MNRKTGTTFIILGPSGKILMQLRDFNSKRYANKWCFPGGTIEPDEIEVESVIREINEEYELELRNRDCKKLMEYDLSYGVRASVFICRINKDQKPVLHEGAAMEWMNLKKIKKLDLGFEQEKIIPEFEKFLKNKS